MAYPLPIRAALHRRRLSERLSGGVAGFSPLNLDNLIVWYDISPTYCFQERTGASATTASGVGDPVGTIVDRSGNNHYATAATDAERPTLRQSSGKYWLEFDGSVHDMEIATLTTGFGQLATIYWAAHSDDVTAYNAVVTATDGGIRGHRTYLGNASKAQIFVSDDTNWGTTLHEDTLTNGVPVVYAGYSDGTDVYVRLDGVEETDDTNTTGYNAPTGSARIGSLNGSSLRLDGGIYGIAVTSDNLTSQEKTDMDSFFLTKVP